jgi:tripartite-type tricarboxylate transporter receptor subunit TctC
VVGPITDVSEGRIQAYVGALAIVQPHVQSGRVKLIAITNSQRAPTQKDTPTVAEAGFPQLNFDGLIGLFGPRDMPAAVRDRIAADIKEAVSDPAITARLTATGQVVSPGTGAEFKKSMDEQSAKLAAIVKQLGIKPQ